MSSFHNRMAQTAKPTKSSYSWCVLKVSAATLASRLAGFLLFNTEKYVIKNQHVTLRKSDFKSD